MESTDNARVRTPVITVFFHNCFKWFAQLARWESFSIILIETKLTAFRNNTKAGFFKQLLKNEKHAHFFYNWLMETMKKTRNYQENTGKKLGCTGNLTAASRSPGKYTINSTKIVAQELRYSRREWKAPIMHGFELQLWPFFTCFFQWFAEIASWKSFPVSSFEAK